MAVQIKGARLPAPELEYRFDEDGRRWKFDFCWVRQKVALEVEGGAGYAPVRSKTGKHIVGHHVHPSGFESDCEKYSIAAIQGWKVIRVTGTMINDGRALNLLEKALGV